MNLSELVGKTMQFFEIRWAIEVYRVDEDGLRIYAVGYFTEPHIAEVFVGTQVDGAKCNRTREVLVLTNGNIAFLVSDDEQVEMFDDKEKIFGLREVTLSKLTPAERKLLGLQ